MIWSAFVWDCLAALARIQSHLPGDSWLKASSIGQSRILGSAAMSFFEPRLKPLPDAFYSEGDASPVRPDGFARQWGSPKSGGENDRDHHFPVFPSFSYSNDFEGAFWRAIPHFSSHSGAPQQRWVAIGVPWGAGPKSSVAVRHGLDMLPTSCRSCWMLNWDQRAVNGDISGDTKTGWF